jgi:hypothetical protein
MKKYLIPILAGVVMSCTRSTAQDLTQEAKIQKEFTVTPNTFMGLYNLNGSIKVEGYNGNKVIVEIKQTISADNKAELEIAQKEVKLGFDQSSDSLVLYTAEPYDTRPKKSWNKNQWNREIEYQIRLDYVIKVPHSMQMRLSTVNDGDIVVRDVQGLIRANNVNGSITLKNIQALKEVHTVNGDVKINFTAVPTTDAKFYTLNGDLDVTFPKNLSADCEMKSWQGDFFTDFEEVEKLTAKSTSNVKKSENSTQYKLEQITRIRIGKSGGQVLKFETMNGNVYIRKES